MNGSDPGVIRQLTEIVIATRQSSDPAQPCNIHTRPSRVISLGRFILSLPLPFAISVSDEIG